MLPHFCLCSRVEQLQTVQNEDNKETHYNPLGFHYHLKQANRNTLLVGILILAILLRDWPMQCFAT